MSKRIQGARQDELPDDVRFGLVEALFADTKSMIVGAIITGMCGIVITAAMQSWAIGAASAAMFVVTAVRIFLVRQRNKKSQLTVGAEIERRALYYVVSTCVYTGCVGIIGFFVILYSSDPFVIVIMMTMAMTNIYGVAVRNFAIEYGIGWQIGCVAIPLAIAFVIRGEFFAFLIPMLLAPVWVFVQSSATRLRGGLLSEMAYRRRSETIAAQFDFAINNMSHGMSLISGDQEILVSNAKFAELFGLPADRPIANRGLKSLLRLAVRRGLIAKDDAGRLLTLVTVVDLDTRQRELQIESATGRTYDITLTHHLTGGCVIVAQDVTEKRDAERVIDRMARFDAVTNLRNRGAFELALTESLAAAKLNGARTDVLFIDLDRFKQVNDTLGHKVGDKMLVIAGNRLSALARECDFIARWGGDEFVVLRSRLDGPSDIEAFAAEIIAELSRPCSIEGTQVVVGASIGIAAAIGGYPSADTVLQQADMALYTAKREGRGRYRVYEEMMSTGAQDRRLLELELHAALAGETFTLHYQPIVDLETRAVVGLEALARWFHPTRGNVSPATFVPVLEELNLIHAFGAWTLQRACLDAMLWPPHIRVSVNVSAKQLEGEGLYDTVRQALQKSGLEANRLELEITETALLGDSDAAQRTLRRIHKLGVRIALDDFGTGYSSLSHLMTFPLDKVKIDRSFTALSDKEEKAAILIGNVANLSRQLGMVVTIEGIETFEQLERMKLLAPIAEGQGYLFSKPLPNAAVEKMFAGVEALHVA